ncbi:MAG: 3D domain protein [candidate division WWE3 bacterium GW2011_GWC1_41_7]|uniref:3D domain protein n=2 Tax=Katanobacteria TaxID=422282 RepID=A0A0G0X776_UNCKA|nr:MAG: 3D domain protein [candidate division WWE3 bacterium GW2011_GWB1_41_6]KKS20795.1 MAG: 3D domain protein [candidate division WWE3 bacterium GW2011_GWC1_41_7]
MFLIALAFFKIAVPPAYGEVLGVSTAAEKELEPNGPKALIAHPVLITTTTAFDQKETEESVPIPYSTVYEKDPEVEYGKEEVKQEGVSGTKTYHYLITFWEDEVIDKRLLSTEQADPVEEIISKGTKIVWRMLEGTESGRLKYWYKLKVWATKYDGNCIGCTGRTYSGTLVKKGVCATDPSVIPLGTNFYVAGYGLCRAEDIGGGIKGDMVDLGYEKASDGSWRTGWTEVYLLTNAPE